MLTNYILIQLNGQPFNCSPDLSLKDLLVYLGLNLATVVVEYNYEIVQSNSFNKIVLVSGDKVEVLTIVGGG